MKRPLKAAAVALVAACAGSATTESPSGVSSNAPHFTATVNGTRWSATTVGGSIYAFGGGFEVHGSDFGPASSKSVSLSLGYIPGPGTYPLGVDPGAFSGGTGSVRYIASFQHWITPNSGNAGFVTIREVSPTRMAGSFEFAAVPVTSGSVLRVTSGDFNVPLSNLYGDSLNAANVGMQVSGTVGGTPYNAGRWYSYGFGTFPNKQFTLVVSDTTYKLDLYISEADTAGTYVLGTGTRRSVAVSTMSPSPATWGGTNATSAGTFVRTSVTATRLKGAVNAVLQPTLGATGLPLNITVAFEVRRN